MDRWKTLPHPSPMPMPTTSGSLAVDDATIFYAIFGTGRPIVLLHGGLGHGDVWSSQIIDLSRTFGVVAIDLRGHGRSTRSPAPFTYEKLSHDVGAVLEYLQLSDATLVGWSDGAIIGLYLAMTRHRAIGRLFSHAANITPEGLVQGGTDTPTFKAYLMNCEADYLRLSPTPAEYESFVEQVVRMWESEPNWSTADLSRIEVPTIVAHSDHDEVIKADHAALVAKSIGDAPLLLLTDVSHFALLQDPSGYAKELRLFARRGD